MANVTTLTTLLYKLRNDYDHEYLASAVHVVGCLRCWIDSELKKLEEEATIATLRRERDEAVGIFQEQMRLKDEYKGFMRAAEAEVTRLRELLKEVQDSAVTISDTCVICCQDLTKHASGCVIEIVAAQLERTKAVDNAK